MTELLTNAHKQGTPAISHEETQAHLNKLAGDKNSHALRMALESTLAQPKPKNLFVELIAKHPGLAEEMKASDEMFDAGVRAGVIQEREECLKIIDNYEIPVGNSSAGEIARELTYGALKDIRAAITARGTT